MILAFTRRSWEEMERDISFTLELPSYNVKKLMGVPTDSYGDMDIRGESIQE